MYRSFARPVLAYFLRRVAAHDADDALADVFVVAWRRLDVIPLGAELPWLYRVARNVLANHRRTGDRRKRLIGRITEDEIVRRPSATGSGNEMLDAAVRQLSKGDQEILRLAAWEGLAPAEIAVVLGITPNAASVRLWRAREALRDAFDREGGER